MVWGCQKYLGITFNVYFSWNKKNHTPSKQSRELWPDRIPISTFFSSFFFVKNIFCCFFLLYLFSIPVSLAVCCVCCFLLLLFFVVWTTQRSIKYLFFMWTILYCVFCWCYFCYFSFCLFFPCSFCMWKCHPRGIDKLHKVRGTMLIHNNLFF